jgi:hypothetical protein
LRVLCVDFTERHAFLLDAPNFMNIVKTTSDETNIDLLNSVFRNNVVTFSKQANNDELVLKKFQGKYALIKDPGSPIIGLFTNINPTGFSIFFPNIKEKEINVNVLDNVKHDELLNRELGDWKCLLNKLYGVFSPCPTPQ